jgi:hypothetical protein
MRCFYRNTNMQCRCWNHLGTCARYAMVVIMYAATETRLCSTCPVLLRIKAVEELCELNLKTHLGYACKKIRTRHQ